MNRGNAQEIDHTAWDINRKKCYRAACESAFEEACVIAFCQRPSPLESHPPSLILEIHTRSSVAA